MQFGDTFSGTELLDMQEAADYLHTTPRHLRELIGRKQIACTRIGRKIRFTKDSLNDYISSRTQRAEAVAYDRRK